MQVTVKTIIEICCFSLLMILPTALLASSGQPAFAQTTTARTASGETAFKETLTVEETVALGLANNPLITTSDASIRSTEAEHRMAGADLLPQASLNWSYTGLKDAPFMVSGGAERQIDHRNKYSWDITIVQPLFSGFALRSALDIADLEVTSRQLEKEQLLLDLTREIKQNCHHFLLFQRLLNVSEDEVKALEAHKKDSEVFFSQGLILPNDLLRAEVALANSIQQREIARSNVEKVRFSLNRLLNRAPDTRLVIEETEWIGDTEGEKKRNAGRHLGILSEPSQLEMDALQLRPMMKLLNKALEQLHLSVTIAKSARYPVISLVGQYSRNGDDFGAGNNDYANDHNASITVQAQWKFWQSGKVRADVMRAGEKSKALESTIENHANLIRQEVRGAMLDCQVARKNIETATKAMDQARENWRITQLQYREQMATSTDVLDARNFLTRADTNYFSSVYGYLDAVAALERAVGSKG